MPETWFGILSLVLATYVVLDGRNFGAGALQCVVGKSLAERRQVIAAIGPFWTWHEVWLVALGGGLFAAFPRILAVAFSGYYLALFMILWLLVLRGLSMELGGHIDNPLWQTFWNSVLVAASVSLALLFGVALANSIRGVPLDESGEFHIAPFTDFGVHGQVGLLDWFTASLGIWFLVLLLAHGATYLCSRTDGVVQQRSRNVSRILWPLVGILTVIAVAEMGCVRSELFVQALYRPVIWAGGATVLAGAIIITVGVRRDAYRQASAGAHVLIASLLITSAAARFPVILQSTLGTDSMTVYNSAADPKSLALALIWWPFAFVLSWGYVFFLSRAYHNATDSPPKPQT